MIGVELRTKRFVVAEDADDGCVTSVTIVTRHPWQCPKCTRPNDKEEMECRFCLWDRADDGWICEFCRHLNHTNSPECETCGRPKPETDR